jgi:hypothetical protein
MGMESLLNFGLAPMLVKKLMGGGGDDAAKRAIADYDRERQEKEKAAQNAVLSGNPSSAPAMKRGGAVKKMAKGGTASSASSASSASKRADGCAQRGKTKGRMV